MTAEGDDVEAGAFAASVTTGVMPPLDVSPSVVDGLGVEAAPGGELLSPPTGLFTASAATGSPLEPSPADEDGFGAEVEAGGGSLSLVASLIKGFDGAAPPYPLPRSEGSLRTPPGLNSTA